MMVVSSNNGIGLAKVLECKLCTPLNTLNGITENIGTIPDGHEPIIFCGTGLGRVATGMSSRRPVYGAAEWADKVNTYPELGFEIALKAGMKLPEYKIVSDPEKQHALDMDTNWDRLSRSVYIKKQSGRPLTVEAFFDGTRFKNYFVKITEDRLVHNNTGAQVGSAVTTIFSMPNTKLKPMFKTIAQDLALECPEYRGVVSISAIIFDDKIIFRYIKFGYEPAAEMAKIMLCGKPIIVGSGLVPTGFASAVTLYDIRQEHLRVDKILDDKYCVPIMVNREENGIFCCGEEAAVCLGLGNTIRDSFTNAYEVVKRVQTKDLSYRPDGGDYALSVWKFMQKLGHMKGANQ